MRKVEPSNQRSPSPSPKMMHCNNQNERNNIKNFSKMDSIEPPPPGFEMLQKESETQIFNKRDRGRSTTPHLSGKSNQSKSMSLGQHGSKQQLHVKEVEKRIRTNDRSVTPPKQKHIKITPQEDVYEKNVDKYNDDFDQNRSQRGSKKIELKQKNQTESENKITDSQLDSTPNEYVKSKSESKDDRRSKEHKKKKKYKSERKKNKKDKKDKRDKLRKSFSPNRKSVSTQKELDVQSPNRTPNTDLLLQQNTIPVVTCSEKNSSMDGNQDKDNNGGKNSPITMNLKKNTGTKENTPHTDFKRFDSVLDIEGYDTDFEDVGSQNASNKSKYTNMQVSKWEREEQNSIDKDLSGSHCERLNEEQNVITTDVIRKAEHAIFARAINAIRPNDFKITIPTTPVRSHEWAVSIKADGGARSPSPKITKSIKERLGSKVVQKKEETLSTHHTRPSKNKNRRSVDHNIIVERKNSRQSKGVAQSSQISHNSRDRHNNKDYTFNSRDRDFQKKKSNDIELDYIIQKNQRDVNYSGIRDRDRNRKLHNNAEPSRNKYDQRNFSNDVRKNEENRIIASVASKPKPSRHDNPFRKFENIEVVKPSRFESSESDSDENRKRKKKDKKMKKRTKFPSMESLNSDKNADLKNKKKTKSMKKKKKSKK